MSRRKLGNGLITTSWNENMIRVMLSASSEAQMIIREIRYELSDILRVDTWTLVRVSILCGCHGERIILYCTNARVRQP